MLNVLVTGSSRGLGLELVKQLAAHPDLNGGLVVATARKCSPELQNVISLNKGTVVFVALDVTDQEIIVQSAEKVRSALVGRSLDILINCAGVHGETHGKLALMSDLEYQLSANVTGAHKVLQQHLPLMQTSHLKKVISISSEFGSMTKAREVGYAPCPAYKISKAALNALMVQYALSYEDEGFVFLAVNPGWLQSDMGGQDADLTVPQGAEAVLNIVMAASDRDNGSFKTIDVPGWEKYDGGTVPW
ncbi:hydroxyacyl dehydrogenase [Penicillium brevicompactum]|uniref:hydroxyacyl dehydrogenase n=1 Tax=Penicillium brevicompactum TaxID=5074 RepID=UPI00254253E1|nr:hydroxyacyl dehydrogenase [Penicillium brevicompactum]KAJ5326333.1 hydroxyacyl dehydrogenase [Penicillium brevicompactum]